MVRIWKRKGIGCGTVTLVVSMSDAHKDLHPGLFFIRLLPTRLCAGLAIVPLTPSLPSDAPLSFPGPSGRVFPSSSKSQCRDTRYQIRKPVSRLILDVVEHFLTNDIN